MGVKITIECVKNGFKVRILNAGMGTDGEYVFDKFGVMVAFIWDCLRDDPKQSGLLCECGSIESCGNCGDPVDGPGCNCGDPMGEPLDGPDSGTDPLLING